MSKRTMVLVAGALVAAGSVAALSAPGWRLSSGWFDGPRGFDRAGSRSGGRFEVDAAADGSIGAGEYAAKRKRMFARRDRNGDGVLDETELEEAARERAERWADRTVRQLDTDHDGVISRDELARRPRPRVSDRDLSEDRDGESQDGRGDRGRGRRAFSLERLLADADESFRRLDRNGDGVIDAAELKVAAAEHAAQRTRRFLARFDANRDGKITREEFDRMARESFGGSDPDDHGTLSRRDVPSGMRERGNLR
jgi:Ca2+-binding EF-hand superfamily protein